MEKNKLSNKFNVRLQGLGWILSWYLRTLNWSSG